MAENRSLATIRQVDAVEAIPDADAIELAVVGGWRAIVRKGQFQPKDIAVYIEIDSLLPTSDPRFAFLASRGTKKMPLDGRDVEGHVLRTIKLRGVVSQGLLLPLAELGLDAGTVSVGDDVTAQLGILKWEPPPPAGSADVVGEFPTHLASKTDAERIQNLTEHFAELAAHPAGWYATEKIDGTSLTVAKDEAGTVIVAGRNWALADDGTHVYSRAAREAKLAEALQPGEAVQAEVYGQSVQANPLKVSGTRVGVFAFWRNKKPLPREQWPAALQALGVPVYHDLPFPKSVDEAIAQATGLKSLISPQRLSEGVIWQAKDAHQFDILEGRTCWKSINPTYLLKHGG